jgi:pyridinium-3,5-biscarboxylic acid mononucleotide sulfurtransferase
MIEEAENVLRDAGFYEVRVRHHETGRGANHLARIELGVNEIPRLLEDGRFSDIAEQLKRLGYAHVTLDLAGYRRGSLNETPLRFGAPRSLTPAA